MDLVSKIMAYEAGELSDFDTVQLFSELVKSGQAFKLQGSYGRTANALINDGWLLLNGDVNRLKLEENGIES